MSSYYHHIGANSYLLSVLEDEVWITLLELEVGVDAFDHVLDA